MVELLQRDTVGPRSFDMFEAELQITLSCLQL